MSCPGECYCGVVIGNDTYSAPADDCNMPCNGNSAQTCGGRGRLNLFVADELQSLEPCGYEPPPPVTTTTTSTTTTATSTTSSAACVSTTVVPPECEYKCGKWCSSGLPDWADDKNCKTSWSNCALQVASCFKQAGWPDSLNCFDFGDWCVSLNKYCDSKPAGGCRKSDFKSRNPPKGGPNTSKTITVTTTCAPSTTAKVTTTTTAPAATTTTKAPVPTPTNICVQPSNSWYGYGPGKPVGGIQMPVVTCNDLAGDWPSYPFKQYNDVDSRKCRKYPRNGCTSACAEACKEQYEDCVDVYAEGCKSRPRVRRGDYFDFANSSPVERRTFGWTDSWGGAVGKCKAQYDDCLRVNRGVTGAGKCPKFGSL